MLLDRNAANGKSLIVAFFFCLSLVLFDSKTQFLKPSRAVLTYVLSPISYIASIPSKLFGRVDVFLENEPEIENAYEHLRVEYVKLKADMLRRSSVERENEELRQVLEITNSSNVDMQIAKSVDIDLDPYQHRVLVNKGALQGIYIGQPVLDDEGILGQVSEVFRSSSVVTLITDPSHSVPVKIQRNGHHVLAEGTGDLASLRIPFLNKNVDIKQGDILETSGLGGRFPPGYPVATIQEIQVVEGEAFLSISANPIAAVESLNFLIFMSFSPQQRLDALTGNSLDIENTDSVEVDAVNGSEDD